MTPELSLDATIRKIESLEEMKGFVEELAKHTIIGGDVRSWINLRKIELQLKAKQVRK